MTIPNDTIYPRSADWPRERLSAGIDVIRSGELSRLTALADSANCTHEPG